MSKQSKATIRQVASLAEVSPATVSMILNQKSGVSFSEETVSRVLAAADALAYGRPAPARKGVLPKNVIVVFLPDVAGNYYTTMTKAVNYAANLKGYDTTCFEAYRDRERELRGLSYVEASDVAGIVFTYLPHNYELVERISRKLPVVVIGNRNSDMRLDMVETDSYRAGELVAQHMLSLGHKHIAFLATALEWKGYSSASRIEGVRECFRSAGNGVRLTEKIQVVKGCMEEDGKFVRRKIGRKLAEECLDDTSITGFIAVNDYIAYGVMDALAARGLRIPEDYSLCGSDDIFSSSLPGVNLTTVNHHVHEKGARAFELLYRKITTSGSVSAQEKPPVSIMRVEYLSTLMVRGSTGPPRG